MRLEVGTQLGAYEIVEPVVVSAVALLTTRVRDDRFQVEAGVTGQQVRG